MRSLWNIAKLGYSPQINQVKNQHLKPRAVKFYVVFLSNKRKFKNDIFESIHESAAALRGAAAINKAAMKEFDESCIDKAPNFKLEQIMQISEQTKDHR